MRSTCSSSTACAATRRLPEKRLGALDYSGGVPSALIVNPRATRVTPELTVAVERALAAAGDKVETLITEGPRHAADLAAAASHTYERLYVFGGDGAFNEVVNGIDVDVPVGFVPGGGTSVLARALGLPRDPVESARLLAGSRRDAGSHSAASTGAASRSARVSAWMPSWSAASTTSAGTTGSGPATSPSSGRWPACWPGEVAGSSRS